MTIMNHSNITATTASNNNKIMSKSTSTSNNSKFLINNYLFNTPSTAVAPNTTTSSSYRIIKNPYSTSSAITFENKRAIFNGNNTSNYFQTIQDADAASSSTTSSSNNNNNNRLYHSNSVESLINTNNSNTDNSLQMTSSSSTFTTNATANNTRKSAFQALKPRSNTLKTAPTTDFQHQISSNSNNSLNMMTNLQQNNREFSEKLYAYKTKIANTVAAPTPSIQAAPTNHHHHYHHHTNNNTRYSYSSSSKNNLNQYDSFDNKKTTPQSIHKSVAKTPPSVNDLLHNINNIDFETTKAMQQNQQVGSKMIQQNDYKDNEEENNELSSSLNNFEQKLFNTTVNNTLPNALPTATSAISNNTINNSILMNSFQFFSHFDVQSILFDYNDIKLKKDSLHTSLNIRTGASAASRQGSMENLSKIASTTTLPAEQTYLSRVNNQYFNNNLKNETISLSSSSSPRPSLTNTQSSSSSSSNVGSIIPQQQQETIKILLSNESSSLIAMSELVDNCPCFKLEIGGDLFRGLGLVKESQRRFMKLNSISLLDKITNYKKELADQIENNFNEPFAIEFQDYGAHFYRYYFFNQDHVNYLGIDKDIGPVAISIKRDKVIFIDNNQHQSEHVYRFIMRTSEVKKIFHFIY